jgi:hypothetical protein
MSGAIIATSLLLDARFGNFRARRRHFLAMQKPPFNLSG